jgi:hypothetical protein
LSHKTPTTRSAAYLGRIYRCWKKREQGEPLDFDAFEHEDAEEFEQMWRKELSGDEPRAFLFRLDAVFDSSRSQKLQLREAVLLAWRDLYKSSPTWEQVKRRVETFYKIKRDSSTWRKLRKSRPFCDYF